ncbi:disease resistance protein RGA5-like isoform X1 [Miscanthus floridulus]|uniref:disease resistance protein RGA5-like isoform X1 n=1 Tax=Miscanthus floridulus TaxID=154761 RepID=UPI0034595034
MAGMAVSAATGVLSSLLSKLSELLTEQYMQRKGVRRDIEFLCRELTDMNAALEKLSGMEKLDVQTKVWRDKVREMAYDIEDCIDIFMHKLGLGQGDDKDGLFHKIVGKVRELRMHYQLANMIQDIKTRVEEQSKIRDRYRIDESISTSRVVVEVDPRLPALFEDAKRLVGIDGPREEISKLLMGEGGSHSGQLKVLSIVGFGGLGKTTLANQVYSKLKNEFECTAFVSVSRTPHMPKIFKDILSRVGYRGTEMENDVQKLIEILRATLKNKRYFVIIDDLWSIKDWRSIGCAFVENNNGSRVITTTRIQDVGAACCFPSQGHVYQMQPLNKIHSRRLFFKRLFDIEDNCPEQFREISDDMLSKCKGVPLAITSISSLLANHMHVEIWEKIHNSLGSELGTNPTLEWLRHVLSLSYNDLSHEHKTCLLYLGTYPEDFEIPKEDLLRKWIAEGFVMEKHGLDLEEAAENCFNELINRSMIQPCFDEDDFGNVWKCQVHDLMLELIVSKCKDENFIAIIDKFHINGASQVRRISHRFHDRDMALTVESMSASQVRSYISFPAAKCMPPLLRFGLLRVLGMEHSFSMEPMCIDLSAINHLFLLRYLRVRNFRVELPKKFGKLKHLMTLDMSQSRFYLDQQLSDFSSLTSLRYLSLPGRVAFKNGLSKLCNLRDLSFFDIGTNSIECIRDLGELTNLRNLSVIYGYSRPGGVENNHETILAASIDKLGNSNLRYLEFVVWSGDSAPSAEFWSSCLACPRHLQRLQLFCSIPKVLDWIAHADRLADLYLEVQELRSDDIQSLAQLPCLIHLRLIAITTEKNIIIHRNTFPSLKHFRFSCDLSCLEFEPAAMPLLLRLYIHLDGRGRGAIQLQEGSLVSGIEHLASLEKISLRLVIHAKCDQGSKIESAWRDAISRHPKSQAIKICLDCYECDENWSVVCRDRNTVAWISGEDSI